MITVLTGENSFELKRALDVIVRDFDGAAEKIDGTDVDLNRLADLFAGATLFADKRLVIIKELSDNKPIWEVLPYWFGRVGDETHLVLVEPKLDKRTKTYKDIKKLAEVREFALWADKDTFAAENWVVQEAKRQGVVLDKKIARALIARIGVDQWQLFRAIEKLAVLDEVTIDTVERHVEPSPQENVFNLLDAALRGDTKRVVGMLAILQHTQDPFMTFGLLSGQVFQLAALVVSEKSSTQIAGDIGAHPYALGKLAQYAKKLSRDNMRKIVSIFASADTKMKSTSTDPWLLIEEALIKTASV